MKIYLYALCLLVSACYPRSPRLYHFYGVAMEMPYHVQVGGSLSQKNQTHIESIIASSFAFIHTCFDHWNPKSELSFLNQLPPWEEKKLSPRLLQLFAATEQIIVLSEGRFDPALGLLISLWKEALAKAESVDGASVTPLRENLLWEHCSVEQGIFCKKAPLYLDFDGIAKGFGIDLLIERLRLNGYRNVYVEWAGDIAVSGSHPNGRPWRVAIRNPSSYEPDSEIIPLSNAAIATSGDYEQYGEIEGKQYCHIINPNTLQPMEIQEGSIASVTVMAPSCAYADGLATSAMTFTKIETLLLWAHKVQNRMPGVSFWIFTRADSDRHSQTKKYKV